MAFRNVQNEKGWSKYRTLELHVQPYYEEETRPGPYQEFKRLKED